MAEPRIEAEDKLICLGHEEDPEAQGGSMSPPVHHTSLFAQESLADLMDGLAEEHRRPMYSRGQNPTVEALERKLARLERAEACKCVASGMGAISAVLLGLLESGAHVLFVNQTYGPTLQLAERLAAFGVNHDVVLDLDPEAVATALRPDTRIVWIENPGTMTFRLVDVTAIADLARSRDVLTLLDNSWATPLFQKPIEMGVDLVVHTASKYLAGHSDVMAGAVVGSAELIERIFYRSYLLLGAVLGPADAWLVNRGLRTLPARMAQHHHDGLAVARHLADHPRVRRVFHPGIEGPDDLSAQLGGFSGLFSFELDTDQFTDLERFVDCLELFRIGVSWGGVESIVITPNRGSNLESLAEQRIPPGLVRLSVGLEGADALIADLDRALDA